MPIHNDIEKDWPYLLGYELGIQIVIINVINNGLKLGLSYETLSILTDLPIHHVKKIASIKN